LDRLASIEAATASEPAPVHRLGALAVRIVEDAERLWQKLRLANAERDRLIAMADQWWRIRPNDAPAARALLYRLGPQHYGDRVRLAWARSGANASEPNWRELDG